MERPNIGDIVYYPGAKDVIFIVSSVGPENLHFKVFPADYDTPT